MVCHGWHFQPANFGNHLTLPLEQGPMFFLNVSILICIRWYSTKTVGTNNFISLRMQCKN